MPIVIRANEAKYKSEATGEYVGFNVIGEVTTDELVAEINEAGETQVDNVEAVGATQVSAVNTAGATQLNAVNAAGTTQVGNVNTAGTTQVNAVNQEGTTQVGLVSAEGATQVQAVEDKGTEVLESIPDDYEEKMDQVNDYLENLVVVSDTQPESESNKLWFEDQAEEEIEVPTYEEFEALSDDVSNASNAISALQPTATTDDVGKAIVVKAVDTQTGKPTEYEYWGSGNGWKKIYEYTATGLWDEIEVMDINYETGVITLAPNDSPITSSFDGTCYSGVLIDAFDGSRIKYGNMPVEMWGLSGGLYGFPKAVLVGENQIKFFNDANTSYDSFTYNENVDFSKFKVLARNNTSAPNSIRVNGLDLTKYKYKVCFDITRAGKCGLGVQYPGSTGSASYSYVQAIVNPANYSLTYTSQSNYETWSTRNFGGTGYGLLPKRFEAEIRPFGNGAVMDYTVNMLVFKATDINAVPKMWTLKDSVYFRTKETYIQFACGVNYYLMAESAHVVAYEQEI